MKQLCSSVSRGLGGENTRHRAHGDPQPPCGSLYMKPQHTAPVLPPPQTGQPRGTLGGPQPTLQLLKSWTQFCAPRLVSVNVGSSPCLCSMGPPLPVHCHVCPFHERIPIPAMVQTCLYQSPWPTGGSCLRPWVAGPPPLSCCVSAQAQNLLHLCPHSHKAERAQASLPTQAPPTCAWVTRVAVCATCLGAAE